jgi:hypothetical protein
VNLGVFSAQFFDQSRTNQPIILDDKYDIIPQAGELENLIRLLDVRWDEHKH